MNHEPAMTCINLSEEPKEHVFFVGIGGSGMNTLARLLKSRGISVSGSDREYDRQQRLDFYQSLIDEGISLFPQTGSGIDRRLNRVICSTAVESQIPDIVKSRNLGIPIVHRAVELARQMRLYKSIAVAGTSGKSTVTAMVYWIFSKIGCNPAFISGAPVSNPAVPGAYLDFASGSGEWAVFEADESDGTIIHYHPSIGLIHNLTKDHKPIEELQTLFVQFASHVRSTLILNQDCLNIDLYKAGCSKVITYGFSSDSMIRGYSWQSKEWGSIFAIDSIEVKLNVPGKYNADNALAALSICRAAGLDISACAKALESFSGVYRRFERVGNPNNILVIDDYAHNPEKIAASIQTARRYSPRLRVIYQPHGFGPTRFLFDDLVQTFVSELRPQDSLIILPIYYAGGTVAQDVSSELLSRKIHQSHQDCHALSPSEAISWTKENSHPGDAVLVMGARDPSLRNFSLSIVDALKKQ